MKAKSAMAVLAGLLFSMIGVAWSQNSNTAGIANRTANAVPRARSRGNNFNYASVNRGRDVEPVNKNPYNSSANMDDNSWVPDPAANVWAANAVNANTAPKSKPRRRSKKPRKIAGTPTVGKVLAAALAAGLTR